MFPRIPILILLLLTLSCNNSDELKPQWFKGNLHTHSYWSDGDDFPEMIMKWYKANGYHFIALSDHNILAEGEKWKLIPKGFIYQKAFENYLEQFGKDWVEYVVDTGRIHVKLKTLAEYLPKFAEEQKFLILQAEEITDSFEGKPIHLNATNLKYLIPPMGGNSIVDVLQNNIDAVISYKERTGDPVLVHINHPNFHYAITAKDIMELHGEQFFEIYNGHPQVNNYGDSLNIGVEEMWDLINISYLQENKPILYGIATDDSHNYHLFGGEFSNSGRGWIMVRADSLNPHSLIGAIEKGAMYASTGVDLNHYQFENNVLEVEVSPEEGIEYEIQFIGVTKGKGNSDILQTTFDTSARFLMSGDLLFVRAKVISNKLKDNPYQVDEFEVAWSQPHVFVKTE